MNSRTAALLAVFWGMPSSVFATGTVGAPFLRILPDARAAGMGEAVAASEAGASALFWNPAAAAFAARRALALSHAAWGAGLSVESAAFLAPWSRGGAGASLLYLWMPDLEVTSAASPGGAGARIKIYDLAFSLAGAWRPTPSQGVGAGIKIIQRKLGPDGAAGVALDVGWQWRPAPRWRAGAALTSVGPDMTFREDAERLPLTGRAGLALATSARTSLAADIVLPRAGDAFLGAGGEAWAGDSLALRAGFLGTPGMPALTLGLGLRCRGFIDGIDYAYAARNAEGVAGAHRVSVGFHF